ncbi:MAG: carbohydrate ABC transporter permease [Geminicoccaceae bacterium]
MATLASKREDGRLRTTLPAWLTGDHPLPWLAPLIAMVLAFGIYPLIYAVWLTMNQQNRFTRKIEFVGADNWLKALGDERLWGSLSVTVTYTLACLIIQVALGMGIALLLDSERRGYGVLRALMTLPLVVPPAVTGLMFLLMEDAQFGVLAYYLGLIGLADPSDPILANRWTALPGVMLADIWQWTPFMVLIMLAGLRALPKEPFEAAAIDGANAVQSFFHLTLPMLGRVLAVAVLIRTIDLFRIYDYIYAMTGGGPGTVTETLSFYAGRAFGVADFSYAATLSLITLIALNLICFLFIKIARVKF